MKPTRSLAILGFISATLLYSPMTQLSAQTAAQQPGENIQSNSSNGKEPTQTNFSTEQLLTSTVHQAWLLSGKDEANFFEMVEQLANLSAKNRGITLPDDAAAGKRMGNYIKMQAKTDTDQLLYAVVDKAVLMTSKTPVHVAGAKR